MRWQMSKIPRVFAKTRQFKAGKQSLGETLTEQDIQKISDPRKEPILSKQGENPHLQCVSPLNHKQGSFFKNAEGTT